MERRRETWLIAGTAILILAGAGVATAQDAVVDSSFTLPADADGAVFGSLTVEGENQVRICFARPGLALDLDPSSAPGLVIDGPVDILDRTRPDPVAPLLAASALTRSSRTARPWLSSYEEGPVARFRASLADVARWDLQVMDSTGEVVKSFGGRGTPPAEIPWDGRRHDGLPARCGLTYSFVLEAYDVAGNKRRIVGDGFSLPAYRLSDATGPVLVTAGEHWQDAEAASDLALATASHLNLDTEPTTPLILTVHARTQRAADELGDRVADLVAPLLTGPPDRISVACDVAPEAPAAGALEMSPRISP